MLCFAISKLSAKVLFSALSVFNPEVKLAMLCFAISKLSAKVLFSAFAVSKATCNPEEAPEEILLFAKYCAAAKGSEYFTA